MREPRQQPRSSDACAQRAPQPQSRCHSRGPFSPSESGEGIQCRWFESHWVPAFAGTTLLSRTYTSLRCSALQRLVPPLLERGVILGEVRVIEIDQALAFVGAEADALFGLWRDLGIGDGGVVAH